jgi:hypothetical protein
MGALNNELREFVDAHPVGVLATTSPEGRPQQSLVYFARDNERLVISTLTDRLKAREVRRSGLKARLPVAAHRAPRRNVGRRWSKSGPLDGQAQTALSRHPPTNKA